MYKIYINHTPVWLVGLEESIPVENGGESLELFHHGRPKFLLNLVDQLEKSRRFARAIVRGQNADSIFEDFKKNFHVVPAAGGLVLDAQGRGLFIFRRGYWDLPKGKIDAGESPQVAALREVEEETGLASPQIVAPLLTTWHTYRQGGKRILKPTHWFLMHSNGGPLRLQHEEDIESAEWMAPEEFLSSPPGPAYASILDVVRAAVALPHT